MVSSNAPSIIGYPINMFGTRVQWFPLRSHLPMQLINNTSFGDVTFSLRTCPFKDTKNFLMKTAYTYTVIHIFHIEIQIALIYRDIAKVYKKYTCLG